MLILILELLTCNLFPKIGNASNYADGHGPQGDSIRIDNNTGLMWQQNPGEKLNEMNLVGYNDWRLPIIKELYSLILLPGRDSSPIAKSVNKPFIADGRIKGYGMFMPGGNREKTFFVIFVRGNKEYGKIDIQIMEMVLLPIQQQA